MKYQENSASQAQAVAKSSVSLAGAKTADVSLLIKPSELELLNFPLPKGFNIDPEAGKILGELNKNKTKPIFFYSGSRLVYSDLRLQKVVSWLARFLPSPEP